MTLNEVQGANFDLLDERRANQDLREINQEQEKALRNLRVKLHFIHYFFILNDSICRALYHASKLL